VTVFDYLVLFVLVCSVVLSTTRGLVREVLSLAGWIVAFFIANAYGEELARLLPDAIPGALGTLIVAFLALFIGASILMLLLTKAVETLVNASGLTLADRSLGGLSGLALDGVIVITAVPRSGMTSISKQPFWMNAVLGPMAESAALTIKPFLPGDIARHVAF
jgi:membrane protein required for colicin V production